MVKTLPANGETWVSSLGLEYPLDEEMATHSSILAWRIPWTEGPGGLQSTVCKEPDTAEQLTLTLRHFKAYLGFMSHKAQQEAQKTSVRFNIPEICRKR